MTEVLSHGNIVTDEGDVLPGEGTDFTYEKFTPDHNRDVPVVAVNLGDRAIALALAMEYLNKANQVNGSATLIANGGGEFAKRYGHRTGEVQRGAERNRDRLLAGFRRAVEILAATDAMTASGNYDESEIELARIRTQADLNRSFGVGKAHAADRSKAVQTAEHTAVNSRGKAS